MERPSSWFTIRRPGWDSEERASQLGTLIFKSCDQFERGVGEIFKKGFYKKNTSEETLREKEHLFPKKVSQGGHPGGTRIKQGTLSLKAGRGGFARWQRYPAGKRMQGP